MIDVKQIAKPRNSGSSGASTGGGSYGGIGRIADEAKHAAKADLATFAEQSDYANRAGYASRAAYADVANDLTEDSPVYKRFLRKDIDDTAKGVITFIEQQMLQKGFVLGDKSHYMDGNGNAVLRDVALDRIHDPNSTEANRVLIGAQGFDLYIGDDDKAHLYVDYLSVRNKAFFSMLEIRKVSYSGGTLLMSNAGSTIVKVVYIFDDEGQNVIAYKCYAKADDGTTATANWWKVGMMALCQTFNIKKGVYKDVSNRYYWRLCVGAGQETLEDGKLYDWVILSNVKEFGGGDSIIPSYVLRILADENSNPLSWGGILVAVNNKEANTSLASLFKRQDGKTVDDNGTSIADRTFYGYEAVDGFEPDAPMVGDVIVNVGDQIMWQSRGNVIKLATSTEDNGSDTAPSLTMYHGIGAPYKTNAGAINVWQWKRVTALISPVDTRINSEFFKFFTGDDPDNLIDPWANTLESARSEIKMTKDSILQTVEKTYATQAGLEQAKGEIKTTTDKIFATVSKVKFDSYGNITNIAKGGLVTTDNMSQMFNEFVDTNGNIRKVASIKTSIITKDGAEGTTSISQVDINGDQINIDANHTLTIKSSDYMTVEAGNFRLDKAGNVTITGKINATSGKVAGFTISGNNLTNTPFKNDASIIFRNDTYNTFAGIGGNVLPASSGLRAVARFENHDINNQWGLGVNIAMMASAKNSDYNYAMIGNGNIVLANGYVSSYTLNKFSPNQKGIIFGKGYVSIKKGNVWLIDSIVDNSGISLPTLDEVRRHLMISDTMMFALKFTVVADLNSNGFHVYGRNKIEDSSKATPWNTTELPNIIYHDGQHLDEIWMEMGDSVEFMLVYDLSQGSKDDYDCKYTARVINRQYE